MTIVARLYRSEDRSAERYRLERDATLRDPEWAPIDAVVEDLSATGFFVVVGAGLELGSEIGLGLAGIGVQRARVVRSSDGGYGCEFLTPLSDSEFAKALVSAPADPIRLPRETGIDAELRDALEAQEEIIERLPLRTRFAIILAIAVGGWIVVGALIWGLVAAIGALFG